MGGDIKEEKVNNPKKTKENKLSHGCQSKGTATFKFRASPKQESCSFSGHSANDPGGRAHI